MPAKAMGKNSLSPSGFDYAAVNSYIAFSFWGFARLMTRILLYLLALLTGFSAAEAARPVHASPSSLGSAAALAAAVAVGEVATKQAETCAFRDEAAPKIPATLGNTDDVAVAPFCVHRSDRLRE